MYSSVVVVWSCKESLYYLLYVDKNESDKKIENTSGNNKEPHPHVVNSDQEQVWFSGYT